MKKIILRSFIGLFSLVLLLFTCEKNDVINDEDFTGTYIGTISTDILNKSSKADTSIPAIADISMFGDQIQVHCYAEDFDTTIMLDIYHDGNNIMVCLTGDDFENMYGHMLGQGHMGGGMMGHMQNNESEWMHHLNDEHQEGDEHFGNFNMQHHTFNYTFQMNEGDFHFQGIKE
jgi:hypothetical protein